MELSEALNRLLVSSDEQVVFAKQPWALACDAIIGVLDEELRVPASIKQVGYLYVIDAPTAREVVGVFGDRVPSKEQVQELLLFYAVNDAYPDWVYD